MVRRFEGSDAAWDELVLSFPDANPFQSSAWAAHKADAGWGCLRLAGPGVAAQFLLKRAPAAAVAWARGGPLGEPSLWTKELRAAVDAAPLIYGRIGSYRAAGFDLEALGWRRPAKPLAGTGTFVQRLDGDLKARLSENWAHNLRRGLARSGPRLWERPDVTELAAVYRAMEAYKGLKRQHSPEALGSILARFGDKLVVARSEDAIRACLVFGDGAWDLWAAAGPSARKTYASYALLWTLWEECARRGVKRYDLGGADPEQARGVYDFKKGTGAEPFEYVGEWDWARPAPLRRPAGRAVTELAG